MNDIISINSPREMLYLCRRYRLKSSFALSVSNSTGLTLEGTKATRNYPLIVVISVNNVVMYKYVDSMKKQLMKRTGD